MKNKDFDNIDKLAKSAFDQFEVEFDPMDWVDMQSKLRAEKSIDQVAKSALKGYEVPFDVKDWRRLEKQLDRRKNLYPHVWWLKSAEVGVVALLLLTMFNLTTDKINYNHSNQNYGNTTTLTPSSDLNKTSNTVVQEQDRKLFQIENQEVRPHYKGINNPQAVLTDDEQHSALANASNSKNNVSNNSLATTNRKNSNNTSIGQSLINTNSIVAATAGAVDNRQNNNTSIVENEGLNDNEIPNQNHNDFTGEDGIVRTTNSTTHDGDHNSSSLFSNDLAKVENTTTNSILDKETKTSVFSTLKIPVLSSKKGIKTTDPIFELKKAKLELPYGCKTYIGAVGIIGANLDTKMGGTSVGYGVGLTLDSELSRKFGIRTGLITSFKKYNIQNLEKQYKDGLDGPTLAGEKYHTSNLVILEIPLDLQYTFFENEKWKIYATVGLSANMIASRTYQGSEDTQIGGPNGGLAIRTFANSALYERGLFEKGGQFDKNVFLSVGGSIGLERQLGEKISLYILPSYRHAITPSGMNSDFIHSFGVNIGVKTSL